MDKKILKHMTKTLKKLNDAGEELENYRQSLKGNTVNFLKSSQRRKFIESQCKWWIKNQNYFDQLVIWSQKEEVRNRAPGALWINLRDVRNLNDLRLWWHFIKEVKRYFYCYEKFGWGELKGTRQQISKRNNYMRRQYKKLRMEGKKPDNIYEEVSEDIAKKFGDWLGRDRFFAIVRSKKQNKKP